MPRAGFSLLELLLALGLFSVLSGAAIGFLIESQRNYAAELAANEALQNARHALEVLAAGIRQAGNDPRKRSDDSCDPAHHPCIADEPVVGSDREITLRTDLTGSLGDLGDPDCRIGQRFEDITFRFDPATRTLKMRSGRGRFEPIAQDLAEVRFEYYSLSADGRFVVAPRPCAIQIVRVVVVPSTPAADPARGRPTPLRYPMTLDVRIRSRG